MTNAILGKPSANTSIPPLKLNDGTWALSSESKANAFAKHFQSKWITTNHDDPALTLSSYQNYILSVSPNIIFKTLRDLRESSASGSDEIATRVLKKMCICSSSPVSHFDLSHPSFWEMA